MSIIIQIPKMQNEQSIYNQNKNADADSISIDGKKEIQSINIPKHSQVNANDLSKFEVSMSSKCSFSGDDMTSNLSYDSNYISPRGYNNQNELEKEIEIGNVNHIATPVKKKQDKTASGYNYTNKNNFSSERVIYDEINKAAEQMDKKYINIYK